MAMARLLALVLLLVAVAAVSEEIRPSCDSRIYCQGDLLHTVQMAGIYPDSKTFVDMKMLDDEQAILGKFYTFMNNTNNKPTKKEITKFVEENFASGDELEPWTPTDYNPNPAFLSTIGDPKVKEFATTLVSIWPNLTRRIKDEVRKSPHRYSLIPVKNEFVVPGGRFKEFYYWDSYWVINGLLISEMHDTARKMLDNFVFMVQAWGFIPNGGRVYYLKRSQPPLFTSMVANYYRATKDVEWLKNNLVYVDKELMHWMNKRITVKKNGLEYLLARYKPESLGPRPESYYEDYTTASAFPEEERQRVFTDLKGGAESGWDFSTRWFYNSNSTAEGNLTDIHTKRSIPVDLNSFLYKACKDLQYLYSQIGKQYDANYWSNAADGLKKAIKDVHWNEEDGVWYDYDLKTKGHRKYFSVSNLAPLWAKAFDDKDRVTKRVVEYLEDNNIFDYPGGTPSTLSHSGEQWDYPNAWAPLQAIIVQGLAHSKFSKDKSKELAVKWIDSVRIGYERTQKIFEKYNALEAGKYGEGGEYVVQTGFGWTNGVVLEFIKQFYT